MEYKRHYKTQHYDLIFIKKLIFVFSSLIWYFRIDKKSTVTQLLILFVKYNIKFRVCCVLHIL